MDKPTILVVDDDAAIARLLVKVLSAEGYNCLAVSSAEEAVGFVNQKVVDIIFIDLRMPGINGIEAIRQIKKINAEISFVIITAFGDASSIKEATELGVFDYVTKPFDLDYLKNLVKHIESSRMRTLPYFDYTNRFFAGRLSLEELRVKKLTSLKDDITSKRRDLKNIEDCVDKKICKYYQSLSFFTLAKDKVKKIFTNFYFIIITIGILLGSLFGYIYASITSKNLYKNLTGEKRVTLSDFYKALGELKYWMQKHTEQGIVIERDTRLKQGR